MANKPKKTALKRSGKKIVKRSARKAALRRPAARKPAVPERPGLMELGGKPVTVVGADVVVGQPAPEFSAQANDWSSVHGLALTTGKVRILAAVPSLNTSVCDKETRTFNERASELGEGVRVLVISADLPATQRSWCAAAGVERVQTLSDHMDMDFATKYGTYIKERRWHRRAVFVVDQNGVVRYAAYMPQLGVEPNYDEVLSAARALLPAA
jgi:thiol peroxidase